MKKSSDQEMDLEGYRIKSQAQEQNIIKLQDRIDELLRSNNKYQEEARAAQRKQYRAEQTLSNLHKRLDTIDRAYHALGQTIKGAY